MLQTIRSIPRFACVAFVLAAFSLTTSAQPVPAAAVHSPAPLPGPGGGPAIALSSPPGPMPMLQGVISADEFKTYTAFQQQVNEDPAIKDIEAKIAKLTKDIQRLRMEANATRERLIASHPEIKVIQDKIMTAMPARALQGPAPMPMPVPTKTK